MADEGQNWLTKEEQRAALRIARESVRGTAGKPDAVRAGKEDTGMPGLGVKRGAFVTLRRRGVLRGCVGYTANDLPLWKSVRYSATRSASLDPRFGQVRVKEVSSLHIEISALGEGDTEASPFCRIGSINEIVIGRHGVMIEAPGRGRGLLLPQVATSQRWEVEEFLENVCKKAGLGAGAWNEESVKLYRFTAQVFEEEAGESDN